MSLSLTESCRVLHLNEGYSLEELETAHRRSMRLAHPDMGGNSEQFIQVEEAYEVCKHGLGQTYGRLRFRQDTPLRFRYA